METVKLFLDKTFCTWRCILLYLRLPNDSFLNVSPLSFIPMKITKENIIQLIEERKQTYSKANNAVSAFNSEYQISNDYNDRQIFEIIQNADDAQAKKIEISVDTNIHTLSIYNDGEPFSYEGIKSIMIANSSSKVTSSYIGNKGLGFRSLISWADEIQIHTETFIFTFSRDVAADMAKELNLNLDEIRIDRNLKSDCCPFPMLAIPKVEYTGKGLDLGSRLIIKYKEKFEKNIINQLNLVEEKALLFLKNINTITISGTGTEGRNLCIERENSDRCFVDGMYWLKESFSDDLPEEYQDPLKQEKQRFSIQLAIPEDGNTADNSYPLYNYLPTCEYIGLPFIIHATLELDSSRNHIIGKEVNRYILLKVAGFISEYIDKKLKEDYECDWGWYKMITPVDELSNTSYLIREVLFDTLKKERDSKKLFPTVSGAYVGINDYYYSCKEELRFWDSFKHKNGAVKNVLRPFDGNITLKERTIGQDDYVAALNSISASKSLDIDERASLINFVVRNVRINQICRLWLFTDDNDKLINDEAAAVFTPKKEGAEYPCPAFVRIRFINKELYGNLKFLLNKDYYLKNDNQTTNQSTSESRAFCGLLRSKNIASISDYDKSEVLRTIVSQTNRYIENKDSGTQIEAIKVMFSCLLEIYVSMGFETNLESVKLLDTKDKIVDASELLLYTPDNRIVFGDDASYILQLNGWNIDKPDEAEYTKFLKLLGVNKLIKKGPVKDLWSYSQWLIRQHEISNGGNTVYTDKNMWNAMSSESLIMMSDLLYKNIKDTTLDRIVYLLSTNEELRYYVANCSETLMFKYNKTYYRDTEYSYLRYQFLQLESVKKTIISSDIVFEGIDSVQYIQTLASEKKNATMNFLTTNLRGLEVDEIASILNLLPTRHSIEKTKKYIRRLYTLIIDALTKDGRNLKDKDVSLCVFKDDGNIEFLPSSRVYYTDNASIPKALESTIGKSRLYYPARRGANKVCEALGIEPLDEFYPTVQNNSIKQHLLNNEFINLIEDIKPCILLYSTQNVESCDVKKALASQLKSMRIALVSACRYELNGKTDIELNPMEFIHSHGVFYLNAADVNTLTDLQMSVRYCKTISEILSVVTKLEGKTDVFERIFQNPRFMKEAAAYEFPDEMEEVKKLMGASTEELAFWKEILKADIGKTDEAFYQNRLKDFGLRDDFNFAKVDFQKWTTMVSKEFLKSLDSKNIWPTNIDLSFLHKKEFEDIKLSHSQLFAHSLWLSLCHDKEHQKYFIRYQQEYDNILFDGDKRKLYTEGEYINYLKKKVKIIYPIEWSKTAEKHTPLYSTDRLNELSNEERSLFFFPGNQDEANRIITQLESLTDENDEHNDINSVQDSGNSCIIFMDGKDIRKGNLPGNRNLGNNSGKGGLHTPKSERAKRKAGKEAELTVRKLLVEKGFEYRWRSGYSDESSKDDSLGYDFEYKEKDGTEWRYLEVKKFNGKSFMLSKNEYDKAHDEEHKDRYDIALVYNGSVYIIRNFFGNDNYQMEAESFSVYCEIS